MPDLPETTAERLRRQAAETTAATSPHGGSTGGPQSDARPFFTRPTPPVQARMDRPGAVNAALHLAARVAAGALPDEAPEEPVQKSSADLDAERRAIVERRTRGIDRSLDPMPATVAVLNGELK